MKFIFCGDLFLRINMKKKFKSQTIKPGEFLEMIGV